MFFWPVEYTKEVLKLILLLTWAKKHEYDWPPEVSTPLLLGQLNTEKQQMIFVTNKHPKCVKTGNISSQNVITWRTKKNVNFTWELIGPDKISSKDAIRATNKMWSWFTSLRKQGKKHDWLRTRFQQTVRMLLGPLKKRDSGSHNWENKEHSN